MIVMGEVREDIQIGDYVVTDIDQADINTVNIYARKIDFSQFTEENIDELKNILAQMDLWESLISSVNTIKCIFKEERIADISSDILYRPNKYEFESWIIRSPYKPDGSIGIHINYSKKEALRITKGARREAQLHLDEIRRKLKNLDKWLGFKITMETFCIHILSAFRT